jgi:hypothetical protein
MHYSSSIIDSGNTLGQESFGFVIMVWQDEGELGQSQDVITSYPGRKVTGSTLGTIRRNGNI